MCFLCRKWPFFSLRTLGKINSIYLRSKKESDRKKCGKREFWFPLCLKTPLLCNLLTRNAGTKCIHFICFFYGSWQKPPGLIKIKWPYLRLHTLHALCFRYGKRYWQYLLQHQKSSVWVVCRRRSGSFIFSDPAVFTSDCFYIRLFFLTVHIWKIVKKAESKKHLI